MLKSELKYIIERELDGFVEKVDRDEVVENLLDQLMSRLDVDDDDYGVDFDEDEGEEDFWDES